MRPDLTVLTGDLISSARDPLEDCVAERYHQSDRVDDQRARAPSSPLHGVERLVRRDIPNILLSHNPDTFPRAAALGIELSLAGHTHGRQIRFALGNCQWSPASFITPFAAGLYRLPLGAGGRGGEIPPRPPKSAFLYVNRGVGTFGLPVRLGVPPEITGRGVNAPVLENQRCLPLSLGP